MKWPIGLSIKVTFFSVTPITWKGFIQSFEVEEPIRLSRSPDRKRFFLCKEKVRKSKKKQNKNRQQQQKNKRGILLTLVVRVLKKRRNGSQNNVKA